MNKKYKLLEHPADIGLEASGKDMAEAFENAAYGLYSIILEIPSATPSMIKEFELEAIDLEALLVKFLSDLLYYFEVDEFIGLDIRVLNLKKNPPEVSKTQKELTGNCEADVSFPNSEEGYSLKALIHGVKFEKEKHIFKVGVKAVTFHQMEIRKENEHYFAKVFFDI